MRLLIVEDEYYTRQGILDEIDLAAIGFEAVEQADDGVNALEIAGTFRPDAVLVDVRMPRMDGITMSFELRRKLPDCHIVFMSGYADKEYLKAAIELKAVSYVEKPFRTGELRDVLARAAALCLQDQERSRRESALLERARAGAPLLRSEATLMLLQPNPDEGRVRQALETTGLTIPPGAPILVALARPSAGRFPDDPAFRDRFQGAAEAEAKAASLECLTTFKGSEEAALLLYAAPGHRRAVEAGVRGMLTRLASGLSGVPMVIGASNPAEGLSAARSCYEAACSAADAAFFLGSDAVAFDATAGRAPLDFGGDEIDDFQACLDREDGPGAAAVLDSSAAAMRARGSRETCRARDFATRLLLRLAAFAERRGIDTFSGESSVRLLTEAIERAGTLEAVVAVLEARLSATFSELERRSAEGKVVTDIKRMVHRGFQLPGLSLEDIARGIGISPAYACRLFKEATGQTIHRYVTAYRIERAKDLLSDPRQPKMTEVASRAGFADANYLARVFRKETGLSPSEFRDKALR